MTQIIEHIARSIHEGEEKPVAYKPKKDLYSLLHEVSTSMGRGPRQGLAVRPGQNKVLKILSKQENGTMLQQDLLRKLGIRAASLSELLRKLEKDGYVARQRSSRGGNEIVVAITEMGRISAIECELSEKERDQELFGCLDAQDREQLIRILNKLLGTWREAEGETEGQRRERRWKENAQLQEDQRAADTALIEAMQAIGSADHEHESGGRGRGNGSGRKAGHGRADGSGHAHAHMRA